MFRDPAFGIGEGFIYDGLSELTTYRFWNEFTYPTDKADIPPLPFEDPRYQYIHFDQKWQLLTYTAGYIHFDQEWSMGLRFSFEAIVDSLPLADERAMTLDFLLSVANDTLPLVDAVTFQRVVTLSVPEDTLGLNDFLALGLTLVFSYIEDPLFLLDSTDFPEGSGREGWVVNVDTGASSRYEWEQTLTSFVEHDGKFYAAATDGLYELAGDNDDGTAIEALGVLGQTDFGASGEKRVRSGYLGSRTDGTLFIRVILDDNEVFEYTVDEYEVQEMQSRRAVFGRGLRGVYWQFAFGNVDGADIEAKTLKVTPIEFKRRLR